MLDLSELTLLQLAVLVAAVVAGAALVVIELRIAEPVLDLRLLGERLFRTLNIAGLFAYEDSFVRAGQSVPLS